jgi:hypothetical protein
MTNQHSITPPPELVEQWLWSDDYSLGPLITITANRLQSVATQAAQWGSDQELEACIEWVDWKWSGIKSRELRAAREGGHAFLFQSFQKFARAARRPKPPSLKERALASLAELESPGRCDEPGYESLYNTIRRALEALPND